MSTSCNADESNDSREFFNMDKFRNRKFKYSEITVPDELYELQRDWCSRDNIPIIFLPNLRVYLKKYSLHDHTIEILDNIFGPLFEDTRNNGSNHIREWSVYDICNWISQLNFLKKEWSEMIRIFKKEWITGKCFLDIPEEDWYMLGLSKVSYILLETIR